jgi:hypothetical protein
VKKPPVKVAKKTTAKRPVEKAATVPPVVAAQ